MHANFASCTNTHTPNQCTEVHGSTQCMCVCVCSAFRTRLFHILLFFSLYLLWLLFCFLCSFLYHVCLTVCRANAFAVVDFRFFYNCLLLFARDGGVCFYLRQLTILRVCMSEWKYTLEMNNLDRMLVYNGIMSSMVISLGKLVGAIIWNEIRQKKSNSWATSKMWHTRTHRYVQIYRLNAHSHRHVPVSISIALKCVFRSVSFWLVRFFLAFSYVFGVALSISLRYVFFFLFPSVWLVHMCKRFRFSSFSLRVAKHSNEWLPLVIRCLAPHSILVLHISAWQLCVQCVRACVRHSVHVWCHLHCVVCAHEIKIDVYTQVAAYTMLT